MTMTQRTILIGVFFFAGICMKTSLGQDPCTGSTWVTVPGASPLNPSTSSNASLAECQSSCVSQSNCYGVSWRDNNCNKSLDSLINYNYNGSDTSIYYSLIRSLSSCNQPQTCTYYWYGSKDLHAFGGVDYNKTNLNDCIQTCQQDDSCAGMDWDTIHSSCWFLSTSKPIITERSPGVYHFEKNCRILTTIPTTTTTTASSATTTNTTTTTVQPSNTTALLPTPTIPTSTSSNTASVIPIGSTIASAATNTSSSSSASVSSSSASSSSSSSTSSSSSNASTTAPEAPGFQSAGGGGEYASNPIAIRPAYIVLAGLGGGCLLLVLTAVIILCQYPLHGAETYSSSGTLVNGRGYASQEINMDTAVGEGGGEENVEFNPYYNRSELGAPDFTKEENIM